jgi:hypothetical protein
MPLVICTWGNVKMRWNGRADTARQVWATPIPVRIDHWDIRRANKEHIKLNITKSHAETLIRYHSSDKLINGHLAGEGE